MAVSTLMAGIAALGQVGSVLEARKARKDQEKAVDKQIADARNAAAIDRTKDKIGAQIKIGTPDRKAVAGTPVVPTGIGTKLL